MGKPDYQRLAELGKLPPEARQKYGFYKIEVDRLNKIIDEQARTIKKLEAEAKAPKPVVADT